MNIPRIDPENAMGIMDKVVGLAKEIVGNLASNDRLKQAGQVQQKKGSERIEALQAEARADKHEAKAKAAEQKQKRAQQTKEAVNS